jgi:hypothetical protein
MSIAVEVAGRAAEALAAYWRRSGSQDLRTRDVCRRLGEAVERDSPIPLADVVRADPERGTALVRDALLKSAGRDPAIRGLCAAFAPEPPASRRDRPKSTVQNVNVTGNGNPVLVAGGNVSGAVLGISAPPKPDRPAATAAPSHLTILFAAADPTDQVRLQLGREMAKVREQIQLAKLRDQIDFEPWPGVRPEEFVRALLDVRPQVVHFSGHGSDDGGLCFENDQGHAHLVSPDALRDLFREFADHVQCVVLNACFSRIQACAIAEHIPYVVGMSQAIGDRAAMAFSTGFYQALGAGREIPQAYRLGCTHIRMQDVPGHLTPVLIEKPC